VVRDSLTEDIGRIVLDSRTEHERIRNVVSRISRRGRNKVQLYDGDAPVFDHFDVERQLEGAFRRKVWLKSGGYLVFDETEAMVTIDINTGRHKGGQSQEESILQVNLEAAGEVSRQLRLRNIGGLVVIDFIDMKLKRHQNQVFRTLKEALRHDKARTNILPISQLGLLEMTRQRAEESIREATYSDCPYCSGKGKVKSALSMSVELQRHIAEVLRSRRSKEESIPLKISVNPVVMDRLRKEDEAVLVALESKHKGHLTFVSNGSLHMEDFMITNADTGEELYTTTDHS
jgi:ribonuclease G